MPNDEQTLDPSDWAEYHALAREIMDTTVADLKDLETRTGWRPLGESDKAAFRKPLPIDGEGLSPVIIHHHAGTWIDIQVLEWMREALGFTPGTKGKLTSGASLANFAGLADWSRHRSQLAMNWRKRFRFEHRGKQVRVSKCKR